MPFVTSEGPLALHSTLPSTARCTAELGRMAHLAKHFTAWLAPVCSKAEGRMALITDHTWKDMYAACMRYARVQHVGATLPQLVDLGVLGVVAGVACGRALEPSSATQEPPAQCVMGSPCGGGCSCC
eukprot:2552995-Lingulodinium_polyedra.AAC.1